MAAAGGTAEAGGVDVSSRVAVFRFPRVPPARLGCDPLDTIPGLRSYAWHVAAALEDEGRVNHANAIHVRMTLPEGAGADSAALARALEEAAIEVVEQWGEPPIFGDSIGGVASAAWEDGAVVLRLRGHRALHRFFVERPDTVSLLWCERNDWLASADAPVAYRRGAPPSPFPPPGSGVPTADEVGLAAGIGLLADTALPEGEREVRLSFGGVGWPHDLVRIRERHGVVTGELIRYWPAAVDPDDPPGETFHDLMLYGQRGACSGFAVVGSIGFCRGVFDSPPDWAALLRRAEARGLWTLPDPARLEAGLEPPEPEPGRVRPLGPLRKPVPIQVDGWGMTVELRDGDRYRAYRYLFPLHPRLFEEGERAGEIAMDVRGTVRAHLRTPTSFRTYRGTTTGAYGSAFQPCDGGSDWLFQAELPRLAERAGIRLPTLPDSARLYVEVRGQLQPEWLTRRQEHGFARTLYADSLHAARPWTGRECDAPDPAPRPPR